MGIPDVDGSYGLDIFIGEPGMLDRGVGSRAVSLVARSLFEMRGATSVALLTPVGNERAHRAYEKAGFRKVRQTLDSDVVGGERRMSWLMVLDRPLGHDAAAMTAIGDLISTGTSGRRLPDHGTDGLSRPARDGVAFGRERRLEGCISDAEH